ncbi:MAG: adenylate/guanylate cyclase domain-containing protein [Phycisphaeraceae bacterium]
MSTDSPQSDPAQQAAYHQARLDELTGQAIKADAVISRTTRELRQRRQGFVLLSELQRAISTDQTPAEIFDQVIAKAQKALKMDRTVILVRQGGAPSRQGGAPTFTPTTYLGCEDGACDLYNTVRITPPAEFLNKDAFLLATKAATETPFMKELREKLEVPYFVCVPVVYDGKTEALLLSGRMREAKPFFPALDEGDVSTFQSIAGFLASALHNAELFEHQRRQAKSFARFVPKEFLEFLGRERIVDVQLGDQTQKEMTILFSDIRSFTTLSEQMSPKENFDFINRYLEFVAPAIRENGGFIDKYIGDAIMALFPVNEDMADKAVAAAIGLLRGVERFNVEWAKTGGPPGAPIAIGAGLHTGSLMLGTIGFAERMESTVISDAVNLAARMEGLTKMYGASVMISEDVLKRMKNPDAFLIRQVDRVKVKGKRDPVNVFEVFDAEPVETRELKRTTREIFTKAFEAYMKGDMKAAREGFDKVIQQNPHDVAAGSLLARCETFLKSGLPAGWTGVTTLDHK